MSAFGLSPLARGTLGKFTAAPLACRFIPAGAGNSPSVSYAMRSVSVYPRWRGELTDSVGKFSISPGLSPLARGTLNSSFPRIPSGRFIPAGAGNSPLNVFPSHRCAVYPRWRGELVPGVLNSKDNAGLSPLARGTRQRVAFEAGRRRFIPAGAGNSLKVYICS